MRLDSFYVLLGSVALVGISFAQEIAPVLVVFHALEYNGAEPVWTPRAKISINSLSQHTAMAEANLMTPEDEAKLERVVKGGRYQIKVVDTSTGHHIIAWSPHYKPLSQRLKVSLDLSGFLESVSFLPPDVQAGSGKVTERDRFLSVQIDVMKVAPAPETATYIQRLEIERREKEKSQGQDNRSFLSKYWMYIVPIVIFMLISGASNPEGQ
ncbi:ER membrane protein complex subunit 10-like [Varroa jacobsoni]|uniref:ER membrane protein complex subunit 10 n=1 Tax=Varroa destructor TaxID=109461 RepID=A0A7M7JZT1_VARDE|nr:ER membrane protein complex subunit 10-like [Varroa destructor]XP_022692156.1 ER membrane protein complex subunit 10-like [Varroa jacobsoni]